MSCSDAILPGQLVSVRRAITLYTDEHDEDDAGRLVKRTVVSEQINPGQKGQVRAVSGNGAYATFDWDPQLLLLSDVCHWGPCPSPYGTGDRVIAQTPVHLVGQPSTATVPAGSAATVIEIFDQDGSLTAQLPDGRLVEGVRARFARA